MGRTKVKETQKEKKLNFPRSPWASTQEEQSDLPPGAQRLHVKALLEAEGNLAGPQPDLQDPGSLL